MSDERGWNDHPPIERRPFDPDAARMRAIGAISDIDSTAPPAQTHAGIDGPSTGKYDASKVDSKKRRPVCKDEYETITAQ